MNGLIVFSDELPLKRTAHKTAQTIYRVKHSLLDDYMKAQLRSPALVFQASDTIIA